MAHSFKLSMLNDQYLVGLGRMCIVSLLMGGGTTATARRPCGLVGVKLWGLVPTKPERKIKVMCCLASHPFESRLWRSPWWASKVNHHTVVGAARKSTHEPTATIIESAWNWKGIWPQRYWQFYWIWDPALFWNCIGERKNVQVISYVHRLT